MLMANAVDSHNGEAREQDTINSRPETSFVCYRS